MPSSTRSGYPYPLGPDPVASYPTTGKALADTIESKLGAPASGIVTVTPSAANVYSEVTVAFPANRFTAAPRVVACAAGSPLAGAGSLSVWATGTTASSFRLGILRTTSTATLCAWIALPA